ncbi:hypothetical protein DPEC_G00268770 [Dallia pectoralis]|uniref:Uncharacterized protein n=1 Tax=Dallia pectoralis TaxID=75939 RepID=A0ACC2FNZ3_DALPE|nr:hypothetical protein DPEC_G00268770 [Dallia pectoralis]
MSNAENPKTSSTSAKYAHKANQRERADCDLSVKTIDMDKHAALETHGRKTDAYLSKLAKYKKALSKTPEGPKGESAQKGEKGGANEDAPCVNQTPSQLYLSRRRWSTIF